MQTKTAEAFDAFLKTFKEHGDMLGSSILLEDAKVGEKIPASHLNKIRKLTRTEQPVESIRTYPVLMIDTAPTRNNVIYTEASQKKSVKRWPGTTFLFNHKATGGWFSADHVLQAASQMARIYDAKAVKTPKGEIGTLGWFYAIEGIDDISDSFIRKLDAGILREVSIHVSVPEGVICSICNDVFSKCEENSGAYHYPGEKYGNKVCYMSTGEGLLIPLELSAVACPGSVNAHVMQDDEVENYPVVSLREALGGSREVIDNIRTENNMKKTSEEIAAELKKVQEMAAAAGVTLAEAGKSVGITISEAKKECSECGHTVRECDECNHENHHDGAECRASGCECGKGAECKNSECECGSKSEKTDDDDDDPKEDEENDPPEDDKNKKSKKAKKQAVKPAHPLFEGDCVVCGRSAEAAPAPAQVSETETIKAMRTSFQEQVAAIVEKARAKAEEADAQIAASQEKSAQFDDIFSDYVLDVAEMAVDLGLKKSHERDAYIEHLKSLSYKAVREIRQAYAAKAAPKKEARDAVVESMKDRYQRYSSETIVVQGEDGKKKTLTDRRPRFAAS